jgi:hypothetical protein
MSPKERCLEASVFRLVAHAATAPVSKGAAVEEVVPPAHGAAVEEVVPPAHGFLRWLDNWFRTTPEERMRNDYMAYWS